MTAPTGDWLRHQRWFAGKTGSDEPAGAVATEVAGGVEIALVEVGDDRYQLVSRDDRPDSLDDPETAAALVASLRDHRTAAGPAGEIHFHLADDGVADALDGAPAVPLGAEQSNTSLVVDDRWILKVFRRLQPGTNPELEVLRFLADRGAPHVPRLAGWYELRNGPVDGTLGVLQSLVPDATDGWRWVLEHLPWRPEHTMAGLHQLGAVIAELHRALAGGDAAAGFGTEPSGAGAARAIADGIAADAERVTAMLGTSRPDIADALAAAGPAAARLADGLDAGAAIRVHGDLHLGQLLLGPDGWTVIDWEGEPSRPLEERRAHQPALRDVAGLLRSLAYAVATVEHDATGRPLDGWLAAARGALLDGYLATADPALLPASATGIRDLLELLELEKLVYEVGYEASNRPAWLDIPAGDLAAVVHGRHRDRAA